VEGHRSNIFLNQSSVKQMRRMAWKKKEQSYMRGNAVFAGRGEKWGKDRERVRQLRKIGDKREWGVRKPEGKKGGGGECKTKGKD